MDFETPEADAAEQATTADDTPDEPEYDLTPEEADPADVADQHRAVPVDDAYDHD